MNRIRNDQFGCYEWYKDGKLHNDSKPAIVYDDGTLIWYNNGIKHRIDGPAFINKKAEIWYYEDRIHRIDGPACIGKKSEEWFYHGVKLDNDDIDHHKKLINYKNKLYKERILNGILLKMLNNVIQDDGDNDNYYKLLKVHNIEK